MEEDGREKVHEEGEDFSIKAPLTFSSPTSITILTIRHCHDLSASQGRDFMPHREPNTKNI